MRTWCARTCWPRKRWRSAGERCNALCSRIARRLKAEALATTRFETPPGRQLQIDFGERLVEIGGAKIKAFVFVATLGHSRRLHVRAFRAEKQEHWFAGLESAFTVFGGVPEEVLMEIRALVVRHDAPAHRIGRARKARQRAASAT